ncbi:MAG: hypothetical protein ACRC1T_10580 [Clostridium chrysemydis]|uniref:hypothetical protein n=1 Tax=Clostridium TaxID=1485 RepID=UPI0018835003|nr:MULTISPECIES: hypothetical protein [Clostridium]MCR6514354.1 hypothetical protein [Clostridium sp. LY3-2]
MKEKFDYKEWFMSFINVFGCVFFMLTIAYVLLEWIFHMELSIWFMAGYALIYAAISAKSYMDVTVELDPINKHKLEKLLESGALPIKNKEGGKYILGVPFTDKLITKFMEVKLSNDKTVLRGSRKYVEYINKIIQNKSNTVKN